MRHSNSGNPPSTVHGLLLNYCNMGRTTFNYNTANAIQLTTAVLAHYALLHCAIVKVRQFIGIGVCGIVSGRGQ